MKVTIHVATGSNEQLVAEVPLKDASEWDSKVAPLFPKLESRVGDRARRIMAANKQLKELQAKDPIQANLVHNLVLIALGSMPAVTTEGFATELENSAPVLQRVEEAA